MKAARIRDADGAPGSVTLEEKTKGRKVVIFSLPGPFTPTCSQAHMPSFVRTADEILQMQALC